MNDEQRPIIDAPNFTPGFPAVNTAKTGENADFLAPPLSLREKGSGIGIAAALITAFVLAHNCSSRIAISAPETAASAAAVAVPASAPTPNQ